MAPCCGRVLDEKTSPWGVTATTYLPCGRRRQELSARSSLRHSLRGEPCMAAGTLAMRFVRQSEEGYAKRRLALALEQADRLGIEKVMVSCDRRNAASAAVIPRNAAAAFMGGFSEIFIQGYRFIGWIEGYTNSRRKDTKDEGEQFTPYRSTKRSTRRTAARFMRWRGGLKEERVDYALGASMMGAGRAGADKLARLLCAPLFRCCRSGPIAEPCARAGYAFAKCARTARRC